MKTRCYSVRLKSLVSISDKAFKAVSFDGSEVILPKSQVIAPDMEVEKCEAWWISAWILEKNTLQYSNKKEAWFDEYGNMQPIYHVEHHIPEKKEAVKTSPHAKLVK